MQNVQLKTHQDKRCTVFLKKRDKYALPISLTYNGLKKFPTATGGVLSITSTLVIIAWLILNVFNILNFENTISQSLNVVSIAGSENPTWSMTSDQTLLAFTLMTTNTTVFPLPVSEYISAIYMQESYDAAGNATFSYI
jgi:hypothetical protein